MQLATDRHSSFDIYNRFHHCLIVGPRRRFEFLTRDRLVNQYCPHLMPFFIAKNPTPSIDPNDLKVTTLRSRTDDAWMTEGCLLSILPSASAGLNITLTVPEKPNRQNSE